MPRSSCCGRDYARTTVRCAAKPSEARANAKFYMCAATLSMESHTPEFRAATKSNRRRCKSNTAFEGRSSSEYQDLRTPPTMKSEPQDLLHGAPKIVVTDLKFAVTCPPTVPLRTRTSSSRNPNVLTLSVNPIL